MYIRRHNPGENHARREGSRLEEDNGFLMGIQSQKMERNESLMYHHSQRQNNSDLLQVTFDMKVAAYILFSRISKDTEYEPANYHHQ